MAELPYLFDLELFEDLTGEQARLGERMIAAWTRFADRGRPGWERFTECDARVRSITSGRRRWTDCGDDHAIGFWSTR